MPRLCRPLRLSVEGGVLDDAGVDELAGRLGIGARHLSRLFRRHIGASPVQIAKTFRLQRAKRLLDDTELPVAEVACRAGFKSLRRFNAAFVELYGRPPSGLRRSRSSIPGRQGKGSHVRA